MVASRRRSVPGLPAWVGAPPRVDEAACRVGGCCRGQLAWATAPPTYKGNSSCCSSSSVGGIRHHNLEAAQWATPHRRWAATAVGVVAPWRP